MTMIKVMRVILLILLIVGLSTEIMLYFLMVMPDLNYRLAAMVWFTVALFEEWTNRD